MNAQQDVGEFAKEVFRQLLDMQCHFDKKMDISRLCRLVTNSSTTCIKCHARLQDQRDISDTVNTIFLSSGNLLSEFKTRIFTGVDFTTPGMCPGRSD